MISNGFESAIGVHAAGEKRDASREAWVMHRDPLVQLDAAAVTQSEVEQRSGDIVAPIEREFRRVHTLG
jgi:hypothetical protein